MGMTDTSLYLASQQEIDVSPRFRLSTECGVPGVESRVGTGWVGACAVSFLMNGVQCHDVLSSVDDALLVAGLLSSPLTGASDIRILESVGVGDSYCSAIEWGQARFGERVLGELLSWWTL